VRISYPQRGKDKKWDDQNDVVESEFLEPPRETKNYLLE